MARKWTNQTIDDWLTANNKPFSRSTDVTSVRQPSTTPIEWRCSLDGHTWTARVDNIVGKGSGCPMCSGSIPLTVDGVTDRIYVRSNATCIELYAGSVNAGRTGKFQCCRCGGHWVASVHNVLSHGYGCPQCNSNLSTPCESIDGEQFHSKLERSFWEAIKPLRDAGVAVIRQGQYLHTRRFTCDFYFPNLMLIVEISGKAMLSRDDYRATIELKHRMAEASHRQMVVLSDNQMITDFAHTLENLFT